MNLNTLINYKHSLFQYKPIDTTDVKIIKSKCFGFTWYAVRNNELLCVLDSTVAEDSYRLYATLDGRREPHKVELEMYAEESR